MNGTYLDTSSLLKFLLPLPGDEAVELAFRNEQSTLIISDLADLETRVQLRAQRLGGLIRLRRYQMLLANFDGLTTQEPFVRGLLSAAVFKIALRQQSEASVHCRSLDRLHLAAMEELGLTRLMTHDVRQAEAARALGYTVLAP